MRLQNISSVSTNFQVSLYNYNVLSLLTKVGNDSTPGETKCKCSTLTQVIKTFSGGIDVPTVNAIDFSKIFSNFSSLLSSNPAGLATIVSILALYILLLVWARRKDRQDIEKVIKPFITFVICHTTRF